MVQALQKIILRLSEIIIMKWKFELLNIAISLVDVSSPS